MCEYALARQEGKEPVLSLYFNTPKFSERQEEAFWLRRCASEPASAILRTTSCEEICAFLLDDDRLLPDVKRLPEYVGEPHTLSYALAYLGTGMLDVWRSTPGATAFFRRWYNTSFAVGMCTNPDNHVASLANFKRLVAPGNVCLDPATQPLYRAEVEFLSRAEWEKELPNLLDDLTPTDGPNAGRVAISEVQPDNPAYDSWCRVYAVYGDVFKHSRERSDERGPDGKALYKNPTLAAMQAKLAGTRNITHALGTVKQVSAADAGAFRRQLETYMDSKSELVTCTRGCPLGPFGRTSCVCGSYWPIVKQVRVWGVCTACVLHAPCMSTARALYGMGTAYALHFHCCTAACALHMHCTSWS